MDYIYSIITNFPASFVSSTCLDSEINNSSIVTSLDGILIEGDVVTISFVSALSGADQTTLDGIVVAHNNSCPLEQNQQEEEEAEEHPLIVQEDDVQVVEHTNIVNFEGNVTVTDEGSGKSTVTITGGGSGGANFEVCYGLFHQNNHRGFFAVEKLKERFTFVVPDNFTSLVSLDMIYIPSKNINYSNGIDLRSHYGKIGEDYDNHSETVNHLPIVATKDKISTFDISPVFSQLEAGDHCGIKIKEDVSGYIYVICIRLRYN